MLEGLGLRAIRDALPGNPVAQERLVGTILLAMSIADVRIAMLWRTLDISDLHVNAQGTQ